MKVFEEYMQIMEDGGLMPELEKRINKRYSNSNPIDFFKENFARLKNSIFLDWSGSWEDCFSIDSIIILLKDSFEEFEFTYKIEHVFCDKRSKQPIAKFIQGSFLTLEEQTERYNLYNEYSNKCELNFNYKITINEENYEHYFDIWNGGNTNESYGIEFLNFLNSILKINESAKKWFLGYTFCTKEQYEYMLKKNLIKTDHFKYLKGLNSMDNISVWNSK